MDILDSVILGVIEGFTEFLPISSTGHMIVVSKFLGIKQTDVTKAYEVIIQFAAILAVVFNYKDKLTPNHINLWIKVFISFLPLAIIGYIFKDQIKELFSINVVAIMFIVGGVIFLVMEWFFIDDKKASIKDVEDVGYKEALVIGVAQVLALIPGTSRAGSTIIGALSVGLSRKASAEYSFLLALPVMSAVSAYDFLKHYKDFASSDMFVLGVGFITAFITAYITMKLFLSFLERFTFVAFGVYRIVFGIVLLYLV